MNIRKHCETIRNPNMCLMKNGCEWKPMTLSVDNLIAKKYLGGKIAQNLQDVHTHQMTENVTINLKLELLLASNLDLKCKFRDLPHKHLSNQTCSDYQITTTLLMVTLS